MAGLQQGLNLFGPATGTGSSGDTLGSTGAPGVVGARGPQGAVGSPGVLLLPVPVAGPNR